MKYTKPIWGILTIATVYIITSGSCIPKSILTIKGTFLGTDQTLSVSDLLAAKIINNEKTPELIDFDSQILNNTLISTIAQKHSLDAATLYTLKRLYDKPLNKTNQDKYTTYLNQINLNQMPSEIEVLKSKYFLFIPGFAYKEDSTTGADFARQRQLLTRLGIPNQLIETGQFALSADNAKQIVAEISRASIQHTEIVLVSASKGGLETAMALGNIMEKEAFQKVKAWVNVGGILNGSPIADQYLKGPKCWFAKWMLWTKGQTIEVVRDISHHRRKMDFVTYQFPKHINIINFVGVPLTSQVHPRIKSRYCSIQKEFGPNDGLTTIPDEITENGIVISELGLDHYFKDPNIDKKTLALACLTVKNE